jgi:hypothetical protein
MTLTRSFLFTAVCALPFSVAACGSDDKTGGNTDPDGGQVTPEGTHYQYVVDQALVPVDDTTETSYGLDLGTDKSSTALDGSPDNELAQAFSLLATFKFPIQETITQSVDRGSILLLADLQTTDFTNASAAGLSVKIGATPTPPACDSATDTTCRHHLDGNGKFTIATNSPADSSVTGKIAGGTFTGGPGNLTLQIALGTTNPITLNLSSARVKATQISATEMTAIIGGAVLETDFYNNLIPAIADQVAPILARDCSHSTSTEKCGCDTGSTGLLVVTLFDKSPADCAITANELGKTSPIGSTLQPDVCSTASCTTPDALSIGVKVHAVKASF